MKIKRNLFPEFCIAFFVLMIIFTESNLTLILSLALLVGCMVFQGKLILHWNLYFTFELLFLIFCVFQLVFDISVIPSASFSVARRMAINFVSEIAIYNLIMLERTEDRPEDVLRTYTNSYVLAMVVLFVMGLWTGSILSGRFSTVGTELSIFGIDISVGVGTTIGYLAASAFAMAFITYIYERKKIYAVWSILMLLIVLLSATRKVLLLCGIVVIFAPFYRSRKSNRFLNLIKYGIIALIALIAVMEIPYLYEIFGVRIERTIVGFLTGEVVDNSEAIRDGLRMTAIREFANKPLFGWGLFTFKEVFGNGMYCHCNYLEILYSCGIVGTLIFYSKYVWLLVSMIRCLKKCKSKRTRYYLVTSLVVFLTLALLEYWQVTYYLEKFILINIFMLAFCRKIEHQSAKEKLDESTNSELGRCENG